MIHSGRLHYNGEMLSTFDGMSMSGFGDKKSIVGVGFCLKPLNPPCISGRFNHDCYYLEKLLTSGSMNIPNCCKGCLIKDFGTMALYANSAFYIMTSAQNILFDIFEPALNKRKFSKGLFVLCRYSFRPFIIGMMASGIDGLLFPFESGDCRDYKTWVKADVGIKNEQTCIIEQNENRIKNFLKNKESSPVKIFKKNGNIFYPG